MELLLKGKVYVGGVMLGFIENLKNKYNMQVHYLWYDKSSKILPSKELANRKG